MKIFSNGCSYTWGGSLYTLVEADESGKGHFLDYYNESPKNIDRLSSVYPHHLGKVLGAEKVYNLSMGGGSNARIARTTIEFFQNAMIAGENLTDYFVTIQWTDSNRAEFYDNNLSNTWVGIQHGYHFREGYTHNIDGKNNIINEIKDYYYKCMHSDMKSIEDTIQYITMLGSFLKVNNIPYVFFSHVDIFGFYIDPLVQKALEKRIELIDKQYVWWNGSSRQSVMGKTNFDAINNSHPSRLGHKQWADTLHKWITKNNLIKNI